MQTQLFFAVLRGASIADRNCFGIIFYFVTDTDTEKYYFRIISAMNSDKRYRGIRSPYGPLLTFCEMLSQYPESACQGFPAVARGGHQQFATQTLLVHLLGVDVSPEKEGEHSQTVGLQIGYGTVLTLLSTFGLQSPRPPTEVPNARH